MSGNRMRISSAVGKGSGSAGSDEYIHTVHT